MTPSLTVAGVKNYFQNSFCFIVQFKTWFNLILFRFHLHVCDCGIYVVLTAEERIVSDQTPICHVVISESL